MKKVLLAALMAMMPSALFAADSPPAAAPAPTGPAIVPFMVDPAEIANLQTFLADKPFNIADPILTWLAQKEQAARQAAATPAAAKK